MKRPPDPVFVFGVPRSGTTLLSVLLDQHSRVVVPPEPWIVLAAASLGCSHPRNPANSELLAIATQNLFAGLPDGGLAVRRRVVEAAYEGIRFASGKPLVVDKTPRYYQVAGLIRELFPTSRWIITLRNPLDVAASYRSSWDVDMPHLLREQQDDPNAIDYALGHSIIASIIKQGDQGVHICRYERLVTSPRSELCAVADFLDIKFEEAMLRVSPSVGLADGRSLGDRKILGSSAIHTASVGTWKTAFSVAELQLLVDAVGHDALESLGYGETTEAVRAIGVVSYPERTQELHSLYSAAMDARTADMSRCSEQVSGSQGALLRVLQDDHRARGAVIENLLNQCARAEERLAIEAEARAVCEAELANVRDNVRESAVALADCDERLAHANRAVREAARLNDELSTEVARLRAHLSEVRSRELGLKQKVVGLDNELRDWTGRAVARTQALSELSLSMARLRRAAAGVPDALLLRQRAMQPLTPGFEYVPRAGWVPGGQRIAIDFTQIVFGVSGGVESYAVMLCRALLASEDVEVDLLCLAAQYPRLKERFGERATYIVWRPSPAMRALSRTRALVSRTAPEHLGPGLGGVCLARLREDFGITVLHSPVQTFSVLDFSVAAVLNLHDLQHLHFPEYFSDGDLQARNRLYLQSARAADSVLVSSEFVRDDIVAHLGIPPSKLDVVPVTWNPELDTFASQNASESGPALPPVFGFYPAQFWLHKNHSRLVRALKIVRSRAPGLDVKLVFTGGTQHSGWEELQRTIEREGVGEHVVHLGHVTTAELASVYQRAAFCVVPSLFEASSYPVIEAQLLGCPVICSNVTSLPELVRGGAGLLFDPMSEDDMADRMLQILEPETAAACVGRAAVKVRADHSPEAYAAGVRAIYRRIAGEASFQ